MNETTARNIIELLGKQDERIATLEQLIKGQQEQLVMLPDYRTYVNTWNKDLIELNNALRQIKLPAKEIMDLKNALSENTMIRKNPPEIRHHHYVPKVLIIAAVFFFLLVVACTAWYREHSSVKQYQATDIKYRLLKIEGNAELKRLLHKTDTIYMRDPELVTQMVIKKEEDLKLRLELTRLADEKEAEAKNLRQKASDK